MRRGYRERERQGRWQEEMGSEETSRDKAIGREESRRKRRLPEG